MLFFSSGCFRVASAHQPRLSTFSSSAQTQHARRLYERQSIGLLFFQFKKISGGLKSRDGAAWSEVELHDNLGEQLARGNLQVGWISSRQG